MREIKFRAWVEFEPEVSVGSQLGEMQYDVQNGDTLGNTFADALNSPRCTVMQYTGLKDKNGKEIYEGDYLADDYDGEGNYVLHRIVWDADAAAFIIEMLYDAVNNWQPIEDGIYWLPRDKKHGGIDFEVIGNIYDNPELLQS